jgi:hypothetical protein
MSVNRGRLMERATSRQGRRSTREEFIAVVLMSVVERIDVAFRMMNAGAAAF